MLSSWLQGRTIASLLQQRGSPVEVWAVDFEEQWSALSGATLRAQAAFVALSVRIITRLDDSSRGAAKLALLGHSMGGVVAEAALLLHGLDVPVQLLLSMGAPHRSFAVALDHDITQLYNQLHHVRQTSQVAHVAVSGGRADNMIRPELIELPASPTVSHSVSPIS